MSDKELITLIDLDDSTINAILTITDLENMFEIYQDDRQNLVFDLNKTLYINVDAQSLPVFICDGELHWTTISYKLYGTTRLAWLLWKINNVTAKDIFIAKQPGDKIRYLGEGQINNLVENLINFYDL